MAPSWRQEAFSLIDEEWDEDAENLAPSSVHEHDIDSKSDEDDESPATESGGDEVVFPRRFMSAGAELARHARVMRADNGVVTIPAIIDEHIALPPNVGRVDMDINLLRSGVEFAHTNFHNVANHLVILLGNGFEITLWDHFNADGQGRRVMLNLVNYGKDGVEEICKVNLPENYRSIAVVEKDLMRFLTINGVIDRLREAA